MTDVDTTADVGRLSLRNPLLLASGFLDESAASMVRVWNAGAGGVVTKSIGVEPRSGHPNPSLVEVEGGYVNAMGLPNPGIEAFAEEVARTVAAGATVVGSIFGGRDKEFEQLAAAMEQAGADAVELNVSCPHAEGYGTDIGCDVALLGPVVAAARRGTELPLWVKLAPNVPDIRVLAKTAVDNGADALVCVNTLKALAIDVETRRPLLGNRVGGLSGPALRPVALRAVWDIRQAGIDVPIVGVGGIESGVDVVQYLIAGASAVQIGSVLIKADVAAFGRILAELRDWCRLHDVERVADLVGTLPAEPPKA
jgi:dihydroorotate dehydrogenase (NAD+) catalytic subunit